MKRLALLLPLFALAAAGCFQEETIFVPFVDSATNAPAAPESHAETAETAEPRPGEAGPLPEGAAERSEAGGVSHAEPAESAAETISRRRAVVLDGTSRRWKREPGTTASQPPAWAAQSNVLANTFFCRLAPANRREGTENDFDIESWYFNGGSTNASFRESLALLLDDAPVQGSTILDPDRAELVIRTISNETERVRGSHDRSGPWFAPSRPCRCRTGDRIDFLTDEFDVAVHVAQGRVPDALDLVFRRNASSAPSLLDFPGTRDPDAETSFSLFSGSTICLVAPSRIEGGFPALFLLRATMLPATPSPAASESYAETAEAAEPESHAESAENAE